MPDWFYKLPVIQRLEQKLAEVKLRTLVRVCLAIVAMLWFVFGFWASWVLATVLTMFTNPLYSGVCVLLTGAFWSVWVFKALETFLEPLPLKPAGSAHLRRIMAVASGLSFGLTAITVALAGGLQSMPVLPVLLLVALVLGWAVWRISSGYVLDRPAEPPPAAAPEH